MAASDMDDIRDIPGYKIILRAVLKSQMQHLVETLSSQTDEESVIITASLSEGTSTHLGSESGKNFLQDHENVKTQFLGFCLKRLYKKNQEKEQEEKLKNKTFSQQQFSESNSFPSPKEDVHPSRLSKASPVSRPSTVRHKPYTIPETSRSSCTTLSSPGGVNDKPYQIPQTHRSANQTPPCTSQTSTSSPVTTRIKTEPFYFDLDQGEDDINNKSVTSQPASPLCPHVSTDNLENSDISVNNDTSKLPSYTKISSLDSDFTNLIKPELSVNPSTSSVQSPEVDPTVEVKVEAISECDMNLEITEVISCQDTNWTQDMSNIGFNTSNAAGNQADIQGGKGHSKCHPELEKRLGAAGNQADLQGWKGHSKCHPELEKRLGAAGNQVDLQGGKGHSKCHPELEKRLGAAGNQADIQGGKGHSKCHPELEKRLGAAGNQADTQGEKGHSKCHPELEKRLGAAGNQADTQGEKGHIKCHPELEKRLCAAGNQADIQGVKGHRMGGAEQGIGGAQQGIGTPQQGQQPIQGQDNTSNAGPYQLQDRNIIWRGQLEWQDKKPVPPAPSARITRSLGCFVSIAMTDQDINTSNWPTKLIMQLMPQTLLNSEQLHPLFKNSRQVRFHFHSNNIDHDHLENLYKVMGNGFAGCVHFPAACDIRVLLLLFSSKKRSFVGLIPNDQRGVVAGIRQVITQHKMRMESP